VAFAFPGDFTLLFGDLESLAAFSTFAGLLGLRFPLPSYLPFSFSCDLEGFSDFYYLVGFAGFDNYFLAGDLTFFVGSETLASFLDGEFAGFEFLDFDLGCGSGV
jgi:hypothetical protein